jgi:hypothetical protein
MGRIMDMKLYITVLPTQIVADWYVVDTATETVELVLLDED